ncbi:type II secretion system inner membrane protein GspF [Teredinibacter sp. KSP-S5-2]|uniref:type II secretion system inner membrane protein GspF n=1 Tax=Teredinibacter sp. KSP-S5-2 TaxID=3034506 RepID=UPI0029351311|nr:type II secretion system inner membrane protein GspF [Teredinibacter sp. KSP-S5-2]WNO08978.1 type II secretion system inner membrane protein GspF [Teredinibacter sp. KSP-S5-2]
MPAFTYQALDAKGKKVKGVIEGDSERHVRNQLRAKQLKPLTVKSSHKKAANDNNKSSGFSLNFNLGGPRLGYRDISLLTRQLASLIQSGLPLDEVLQATAKQSRKPAAKTIMLQVRSRVLEGLSLAQSMAELPRVFDHLYRAMIRAGESSGYLGPVLEQLADYTERSQETKQKLQMAMIYPITMLVVSITVVSILMVKVVPKLMGLFENSKTELPFATKLLIAMSNFLVNYGFFLLLGVVGVAIFISWLLKSESRQKKWHKMQLKLPVFGNLILQSQSARYSSTLGLLTNSGVPLLEALKIAAQVLTNRVLKEASAEVAMSVQEGMSLNKALAQVDVFPPLLVQMVASGEANGQLAEQLLHVSKNQERELEFSVNTAMGLLEPFMVLFMGGMVVFIVMAILLPIFKLNQMVGM